MLVAVLDRSIDSLIDSLQMSTAQPLPQDTEGAWVVHTNLRSLEGVKWELRVEKNTCLR